MAARIKKSDPEMLLTSFCDILTISISALFMATIITVFEATKVPELRMTPKTIVTGKTAYFFECRNNELFNVNKAALDDQVAELLNSVTPGVRSGDLSGFLKALLGRQVTNEYYRVNPSYLLTAIMALEPREEARGESVEDVDRAAGKFQIILNQLDPQKQYIAFLVRDDSFQVFRKARFLADERGFDTGWEMLGIDEPIKFGAGGQVVGVQ
ncbi:MAG: hypothetical protein FJ395_00325 [Verrucomicrobia bacterium]|nr:hypothetical protein [Verrucomicrobiota bacterium]